MIRLIKLGGGYSLNHKIRKEVGTGLSLSPRLTSKEGGRRRKGGDSRGC